MKKLSTALFVALFAFVAGGAHAADSKTTPQAKAPAAKTADAAASAASAPAKKKKAKKGGC